VERSVAVGYRGRASSGLLGDDDLFEFARVMSPTAGTTSGTTPGRAVRRSVGWLMASP
jgi:hypothetical protein